MLERQFQSWIIHRLQLLFEGCIILKNDTDYIQGVPDLLILYKNKWAMLEVKASRNSSVRPNQDHYIELLNEMSFAAFIYPENEEEVLHDLQRAFEPRRSARLSKPEQIPLD